MTIRHRSRIWHYVARPALLILLAQTLLTACNRPALSPTNTPSSAPAVQVEAIANTQRDSTARFVSPQLAFDKSGVLHLTYIVQSVKGNTLFHQQRAPGGSWSTPEPLRDLVSKTNLITRPTGEVCALWTGYIDVANLQGTALLMRCQTSGVWSEAQNVGDFNAQEPVFAPDGTPHALIGPNTVLLNGTYISGACVTTIGLLAIDSASQFHVVWSPLPGDGCTPVGGTAYSSSTDGGKTWSKLASLDDTNPPVALLADRQGRVHVLLGGGGYRQWSSSTGWGAAIKLGLPFNYVRAMLDADDTIHLVAVDFASSPKNLEHYYVHQQKDGTWSAPITIVKGDDLADANIPIAVDAQGKPHFVWLGKDGNLYEATLSGTST